MCEFENECLNEGKYYSECKRNKSLNDNFEKRFKKVCNTDCEKTLTKGKEYEIIRIDWSHCYDGDIYVVKDDLGKECRTLDDFFN